MTNQTRGAPGARGNPDRDEGTEEWSVRLADSDVRNVTLLELEFELRKLDLARRETDRMAAGVGRAERCTLTRGMDGLGNHLSDREVGSKNYEVLLVFFGLLAG